MFNKFRTLGKDSVFWRNIMTKIFSPSKDSVTDLLKILDKDLSALYKDRSGAYTVAASFYCFAFEILYNRGELSCRSLAIYLLFLHLLGMHWAIHKGYHETKRTFPVIPWELDTCQGKGSFLGGFENYCISDYPSFLSFFVTLDSFLRVTWTSD